MTSRRRRPAAAGLILAGALVAGCAGTPGEAGPSAAPSASATASTPTATPSPALDPGPSSPTTDPGTLPQTRARPSGTDPAFRARMDLFWQAVTTGDPAVGYPSVLPEAAYRQVTTGDDPDRDYTSRLIALFDDDIQVLHARVGAGGSLLALEVPDTAAQWVGPGTDNNTSPYWQVLGTRVRYRTAAGQVGSFGISSLVSWRGQWYVMHIGPVNRPNQGGATTG